MRRGVHAGMPLGTLPCLMPATYAYMRQVACTMPIKTLL